MIPQTIEHVESVLQGYGVHQFTKDIIREGKTKDCVDAYHDVMLAAKCLEIIMNDALQCSMSVE